MAAATGFVMDKGWKRLELAFDASRFKNVSRKHLRRATELNGLLALRASRQAVKKGGFQKRSTLTIHIAGAGKKPLIDTATRLFQGMTSSVRSDTTAFVGFLLNNPNFSAAVAVHEGAVIKVSSAMRALFRILWLTSLGQVNPSTLTGRAAELWERAPGGWWPLKPSTVVIVIPARPFIKRAFEDKKLHARVKVNWERAVQRTLREQSKGKK
ncbi:hypothetical protein LCGC14_0835780 [marine sediment metagenome]|uniref:Uncharacterized protein n=1 Tax=marine sediment metagenome TaxID=412755 RepID=A0A0F9SM09_9ZZZZ